MASDATKSIFWGHAWLGKCPKLVSDAVFEERATQNDGKAGTEPYPRGSKNTRKRAVFVTFSKQKKNEEHKSTHACKQARKCAHRPTGHSIVSGLLIWRSRQQTEQIPQPVIMRRHYFRGPLHTPCMIRRSHVSWKNPTNTPLQCSLDIYITFIQQRLSAATSRSTTQCLQISSRINDISTCR